ncbi:MAG: methyltransferase domain-containing protein [Ruminococcaceae bacterium]|nr:methyltransferase domain-containing protein [Oscillospiraceae bacterium]
MNVLMCPVCKKELFEETGRFICKNNHSFDISKKGYVNLLMSNASGDKRHGDDKAMVCARTDFLNRGFYEPLAKAVSKLALNCKEENPVVFECGCGECYYISEVKNGFENANKKPKLYGMDISREVLPYARKRLSEINLFVASAYKLPILDETVDVAMSIFAPADMNEMGRIVKKGGMVIKVIPLEEHLIELKQTLYSDVYLNRPVIEENVYFENKSFSKLEYEIELKNKGEIESLFKMTPYYYKTGADAQKKLLSLDNLKVKVSFGITCYIRK